MGPLFGAMSFVAITASEMSDKFLRKLLDMDCSGVISMHLQSVDQEKAIKMVKHKITELDRSKIEEQKKAVRAGYDMDIMRDSPEGDAETPSSAKLKFDSFSMERGPGLRFDRSLDRRTGEVELPSRRRMQEYRNARKQSDNAAKSTHGAAGNAVGNTARLAAFGGHTALSHDEDDSAAADAVHEGEYAAMYASDSGYSSKRKTHSSYSEPTLKEKADAVDSASKKIQKREIQKGYHSTGNKSGSSAAAAGKKAAKERKAAKKAEEGTKDTAKAIGKFIKR